MKKSRLTEERIAYALKQVKLGWQSVSVPQDGTVEATFYVWRKKYGGPSELKRLVADLSLDKAMLPEVVAIKL